MAASTVPAARSAGTAVPAAGEFTCFSVPNKLYHDKYCHCEYHRTYHQAAPVVLKKFQHNKNISRKAAGG